MNRRFHNLARALIIQDEYVLVAHQKGADNTFLPGGHIEIGESAIAALSREIKEEIGYKAIISRFIGCVEASWNDDSIEHFEINHIFQTQLPGLEITTNPASQESHLEFFWIPISDISNHNLLPIEISLLVKTVNTAVHNAFWASSIESSGSA